MKNRISTAKSFVENDNRVSFVNRQTSRKIKSIYWNLSSMSLDWQVRNKVRWISFSYKIRFEYRFQRLHWNIFVLSFVQHSIQKFIIHDCSKRSQLKKSEFFRKKTSIENWHHRRDEIDSSQDDDLIWQEASIVKFAEQSLCEINQKESNKISRFVFELFHDQKIEIVFY